MSWRLAETYDMPAIERVWDKQERVTGYKADRPNLFAKPVMLAMVFERYGEVVDCVYFEAVCEMVRCGVDPEATQAMSQIQADVLMNMRLRGIRYMRVFVPRARHLAKRIAKYLVPAGFKALNEHVHFFRRVEEESDGASR